MLGPVFPCIAVVTSLLLARLASAVDFEADSAQHQLLHCYYLLVRRTMVPEYRYSQVASFLGYFEMGKAGAGAPDRRLRHKGVGRPSL